MRRQEKNTSRLFLCKLFLFVMLIGVSNLYVVNNLDLYDMELIEGETDVSDSLLELEDSIEKTDKILVDNCFLLLYHSFTNVFYIDKDGFLCSEYLSITIPPPKY
ncbi:hypothetical protein [Pseudofulvibacter geojedonensis]|uniref:Uncharacterized protein n=1 Tax=Pseudofulvibacter geojedonensis TaxID=1123758 RepID=A0ABW3I4I5_9FLAO